MEETLFVEGYLAMQTLQVEGVPPVDMDTYIHTHQKPSMYPTDEDAQRLIQHRLHRYHIRDPFTLAIGDMTRICDDKVPMYTRDTFNPLVNYNTTYTPIDLPEYRKEYSFWIKLGDQLYLAYYVPSHAFVYELLGLDQTTSYQRQEYHHLSPIESIQGEPTDLRILLFKSRAHELFYLEA
jgi:hypothetical protein